MEGERRNLEARRKRLALPAIDREMLSTLVDNFERVMAEAPSPQRKDLRRRMVKKVLVHSRRATEIWYALPNRLRFEDCNIWLPKRKPLRNHSTFLSKPEVWLRVGHVTADSRDGAPRRARPSEKSETPRVGGFFHSSHGQLGIILLVEDATGHLGTETSSNR